MLDRAVGGATGRHPYQEFPPLAAFALPSNLNPALSTRPHAAVVKATKLTAAHGWIPMAYSVPRPFDACPQHSASPPADHRRPATAAEMKARQANKIRELGTALAASGFHSLDDQAHALGLSRSTAWTILRVHHKGSGLSSGIICRMLKNPRLPPRVRAVLIEYVREKCAGAYGHKKPQRYQFLARLPDDHRPPLNTDCAPSPCPARPGPPSRPRR
jgi:hypothetical protein